MKDTRNYVFNNDPLGLKRHLLKGGIVDSLDEDGRTPLIHAAIDDYSACAQLLIEAGGNVNVQDRFGNSALHYACQNYCINVAKLLIDAGAIVDIEDEHGNTPLSNAVFNSRGRGDMIQLLLKAGADRTYKNKYGTSPLELADTIANFDVSRFFK